MKIYTILDKQENVIVKRSIKATVQYLTNYGERKIFESGSRGMIELDKKNITLDIKEHKSIFFHTNRMGHGNYYFKVETHEI